MTQLEHLKMIIKDRIDSATDTVLRDLIIKLPIDED